jgi:hypothetical protein
MPDLKSELSKVLNEWNPAEPTTMTKQPYQTITNNITRATFGCVAQTPGITRRDLIAKLSEQGYKSSSSSSMVTQMIQNGNFRYHGDGLFTTQPTYSPRPRQAPIKRRARKAPPAAVPETKPEAAPQINAAWDAETLLNNLSIKQARALYDELRKIFGG